ncbi:MAG: hypothetical protein ACJ8F7_18560 [Gemmataceae bacterium]
MPDETRCPQCGRLLSAPSDQLRQCPDCGATVSPSPAADAFRAAPTTEAGEPAEREPVPRPIPHLAPDFEDEEDDDDAEFDERYRGRRREWRRKRVIERSRSRVRAPAIGLMVAGGFCLLSALGAVGLAAFFFIQMSKLGAAPPGPGGFGMFQIQVGMYLVGAVMMTVFGALILFGANKMRKLQGWGMALAACILAVVASFGSCCVVSVFGLVNIGIALPFGIWGMIVLNDADVKSAFNQAGQIDDSANDRVGPEDDAPE